MLKRSATSRRSSKAEAGSKEKGPIAVEEPRAKEASARNAAEEQAAGHAGLDFAISATKFLKRLCAQDAMMPVIF